MNFKKTVKFFASLRWAVVVIILIAICSSVGTFVESKYDTLTAQKIVYHSWWMTLTLGLLALNLTAVMIDRWPWQPKHLGFVSAHIGIILLLFGSWVTKKNGIDGSLSLEIGSSNRFVTTSNTGLEIYKVDPDMGPVATERIPVDFWFKNLPASYALSKSDGNFEVVHFERYALVERKVVAADTLDEVGGGIRVQIESSRFQMLEWFLQPNPFQNFVKEMGPAKFVIEGSGYQPEPEENALILKFEGDKIRYRIHSRKSSKRGEVQGVAKAGDVITTGWMDIVVRLLKVLPKAKEITEVRALETPTPLSTSAIKIKHRGEETWIPLNSAARLFSDHSAYFVAYANERIPLTFELHLDKFEMGKYPGTNRAASYQSRVRLKQGDQELGQHLIAMNEPLKHEGLTFYQASFNQDPKTGVPVASILSVNRDPGRFLKYFGCALMVFGIMHLFYWRRRMATKKEAS